MTLLELAEARPGRILARLATALIAPFRALNRRLDKTAADDLAIRELEAMPNHILRDIGIDRRDIRRRVRGQPDDG